MESAADSIKQISMDNAILSMDEKHPWMGCNISATVGWSLWVSWSFLVARSLWIDWLLGRLLWVDHCELVAVGWSLWVGRCG